MKSIFDYTKAKLEKEFIDLGIKPFVATQVFEWLYKKNASSFYDMKNISVKNQEIISANFTIEKMKVINKQISHDGTAKFLSQLEDGSRIETVFMPFDYGNSACITTQVGCNMGCNFCASGLMRKERNLTVKEMIMQLVLVRDYLFEKGLKRLSHFVVMGIGEPFDNFDNLIDMLSIAKDHHGLEIGARHITVSTCGIVNKIIKFGELEPQVNLAISLHAPNNEVRNQLMPVNRRFPLEVLIPEVKKYVEMTKRRITFEYIMIDGVNDTNKMAQELSKLINWPLTLVNLIPYNQVLENGYKKSTNIRDFYGILVQNGIQATIRKEKGADIDAACGQLRAKDSGVLKSSRTLSK
jgi:23S rRNA (adenine2503-C2)-methyltransferase